MFAIVLALLFILFLYALHHRNQIIELAELAWKAYFALSEIPGPSNLPLIGSVLDFKWNEIDFSFQLENYLSEYDFNLQNRKGMMKVWLGPVPIVALLRADHVKTLLESSTLITKSGLYGRMIDFIGTGLLISTNEKWFKRRRMITPSFHFNILKLYQETMARHSKILADQLECEADSGREFDIYDYIKKCTLDIICEAAMGCHLNTQTGGNAFYVETIKRLTELSWIYLRFPYLWFPPLWYLTGLGFEFDRHVRTATTFTKKHKKGKVSFLDTLLLAQKANELSDEDIREEVDTFMMAGQETTAASIGWTVWFIGQHEDYQKQVQDELDEIFGGDMDREPTDNDLKQMHFIGRCIKESLRLAAAAPIIARSLTHDLQIGDTTLPKNLTVVISPCGTHRDPTTWERPNEFYPDHFLPEKVAARDPFAYIPFSAGPRNCVGQKFALSEQTTVIACIFRRYRVETVEPHPGNRGLTEIILRPNNGFRVRLFKREKFYNGNN